MSINRPKVMIVCGEMTKFGRMPINEISFENLPLKQGEKTIFPIIYFCDYINICTALIWTEVLTEPIKPHQR